MRESFNHGLAGRRTATGRWRTAWVGRRGTGSGGGGRDAGGDAGLAGEDMASGDGGRARRRHGPRRGAGAVAGMERDVRHRDDAQDGVGNRPPLAIYLLLGVLCVVGSMLFGYSHSPSRNAHWLHRLSFAGITALAIDVILDLELPGRGLIRVDGRTRCWWSSAGPWTRGREGWTTRGAAMDFHGPREARRSMRRTTPAPRREESRRRSQRALPRGLLF